MSLENDSVDKLIRLAIQFRDVRDMINLINDQTKEIREDKKFHKASKLIDQSHEKLAARLRHNIWKRYNNFKKLDIVTDVREYKFISFAHNSTNEILSIGIHRDDFDKLNSTHDDLLRPETRLWAFLNVDEMISKMNEFNQPLNLLYPLYTTVQD